MKKFFALLLVMLLVLGGLSALAEPELIQAEGSAEAMANVGEIALADVSTEDAQANEAVSNASKGVKINKTNFPDSAFRKYVKEQYDANGNGYLSKAEARSVKSMWIGIQENCVPVSCKNMKGLKNFPNLEELFILGTSEEFLPLNSLDVSGNKKLKKLYVCFTNLKKMDVRKNTKLVELNVGTNKVTTLTLGKNSKLKELTCDTNRISKLDVTKCKALTYLQCNTNKLKKLNVTKNTKLKQLLCQENALKRLDLKKNTRLQELNCEYNQLTKLDLPKNTGLAKLWCYGNALKTLNVSKCTKLVNLHCGNNRLKTLDVSKCTKLEAMYAEGNAITEFDIAKLPVYLRNLIRESGFEVGDGILWNVPEDEKGFACDASVKLVDGSKVIHEPE